MLATRTPAYARINVTRLHVIGITGQTGHDILNWQAASNRHPIITFCP